MDFASQNIKNYPVVTELPRFVGSLAPPGEMPDQPVAQCRDSRCTPHYSGCSDNSAGGARLPINRASSVTTESFLMFCDAKSIRNQLSFRMVAFAGDVNEPKYANSKKRHILGVLTHFVEGHSSSIVNLHYTWRVTGTFALHLTAFQSGNLLTDLIFVITSTHGCH